MPEAVLEEEVLTLDEVVVEVLGALETEVIPDLELPDLTVEVAELVLVAPEDLVAAPLRTLVIAEDLVPAVLETEPMPLLTFEPVVEIRGVWTLVPPPKWSCPHM